MIDWSMTLLGLIVGLMVGLTGVGGGSLMTPLLLLFGINPGIALGTDLVYASLTKSSGFIVHVIKKNIDWIILKLLLLGSLSSASIVLLILHFNFLDASHFSFIVKKLIGFVVILTALVMFFKDNIFKLSFFNQSFKHIRFHTVVLGFIIGFVVSLTSIGAGVIGTIGLFLLYPKIKTTQLIGTEIAHAVPLTLLCGLGHASLGNIDYSLLFSLLIGSIPGMLIGSYSLFKFPEKPIRTILAFLLFIIGLKTLFH